MQLPWPPFPSDPKGRRYYRIIVLSAAVTTFAVAALLVALHHLEWSDSIDRTVFFVFLALHPSCRRLFGFGCGPGCNTGCKQEYNCNCVARWNSRFLSAMVGLGCAKLVLEVFSTMKRCPNQSFQADRDPRERGWRPLNSNR